MRPCPSLASSAIDVVAACPFTWVSVDAARLDLTIQTKNCPFTWVSDCPFTWVSVDAACVMKEGRPGGGGKGVGAP